MSSLFLIIYVGSHIGGTVGPLPGSMSQCEAQRDALRASQVQVLLFGADAQGRTLAKENLEQLKTMTFECEYRQERPVIGEAAPPHDPL